MRKWLIFLIPTIFFSSACFKDTCKEELTYLRYDAVLVLKEEYRKPVAILAPEQLIEPGKIYFYNDYILINEQYKGVHIIDNIDPSNPVSIAFLEIIGNVDMAVYNNILYADSYTDLVTVDISDARNPKMLNRVNDVFSSHYHSREGAIISHYEPTTITQRVDCSDPGFGQPWISRGWNTIDVAFDFQGSSEAGNIRTFNGAPQLGIGGSMARFTIAKNHLYVIGSSELFSLPIHGGGQVGTATKVGLNWGIETIFPYKDYLFLGANNGLHILGLQNPSQPNYLSTFQHANACDPVVVQNDIAYVTLRNGNECNGFVNQLEVIDVKDVLNPRKLYTHAMLHPHGLAVHEDELYICEGKFGLRTFSKKDPASISQNLLSQTQGFHAFDVIVVPGKSLLVIGADGFRQYDYSDPKQLKLISILPVHRK
jgi:hypothetical protein